MEVTLTNKYCKTGVREPTLLRSCLSRPVLYKIDLRNLLLRFYISFTSFSTLCEAFMVFKLDSYGPYCDIRVPLRKRLRSM